MNTALSMPFARTFRAHLLEAKYDTVRALRMPGFAIPFLLLPLAIYLVLGVAMRPAQSGPIPAAAVVNYLFVGFCVFAAAGPGLFGGCVFLAFEREGGLLKLKRVLPMPLGANLVAKAVTAMVFAAMALAFMIGAATFVGQITFSAGQILAIAAVTVTGTIPFLAIGLCIGAWVPGPAAPAVANLIFLPMFWLSGLFIPLPPMLKPWAVIWPTFHLSQLALAAAGARDQTFYRPGTAAIVLMGMTVFFGALALRRLSRSG